MGSMVDESIVFAFIRSIWLLPKAVLSRRVGRSWLHSFLRRRALVNRGSERLRKEQAPGVRKPGSLIQSAGRMTLGGDLDEQRSEPKVGANVAYGLKRSAAHTLVARFRLHKEVVKKTAESTILHAETERYDDIA